MALILDTTLSRLDRLAALVVTLLTLWLAGCSPNPEWPVSDHSDGIRFYNPGEKEERGLLDLLRWRLEREPAEWPEAVAANTPAIYEKLPRRMAALRVVFINHVTLLIDYPGCAILIDPVWSQRVSPFESIGPERRAAAGYPLAAMPAIDAILISHNHYDHLDLATIGRLAEREQDGLTAVAPYGHERLLTGGGVAEVVSLDWWQQASLCSDLTITLVPARHWSKRGLFDRNRALWGGFYLETPYATIYYSGDSGWGDHFAQIRERLGAPDLAILPIGAFLPRWFMAPVHISPEEAIKAAKVLESRTALAVHYGTFPLGDDGQYEARDLLARLLAVEGAPQFVLPENGTVLEYTEGNWQIVMSR